MVADGPVPGAVMLVGGIRPFVYSAQNVESDLRARVGDTDVGSPRTLRRFEERLLEHGRRDLDGQRARHEAGRRAQPGGAAAARAERR